MPDLSTVYSSLEQTYDLPSEILSAIETAGIGHLPDNKRDSAVGPKGTLGRFQFLPSTAREIGVTDSTDPVQSAAGAAFLLTIT